MKKQIDGRGLACPAPVLKTKEAIETMDGGQITVMVDNDAAAENVSRFLSYNGFQVSVDTENGISTIEGVRDSGTAAASGPAGAEPRDDKSDARKIMVMITSRTMGKGDDELGEKLMISAVKTLKEMGEDLWRLVFVNGGVKLTIEGSGVLEELKELEAQGIDILVCGTCLNHFNVLELKRTGQTTNMLDIITSMQLADKVIQL